MAAELRLLAVVALLEDLPQERLRRGQVGTIVEILAPSVYEVEFCDNSGITYALVTLRAQLLLALRCESANIGTEQT